MKEIDSLKESSVLRDFKTFVKSVKDKLKKANEALSEQVKDELAGEYKKVEDLINYLKEFSNFDNDTLRILKSNMSAYSGTIGVGVNFDLLKKVLSKDDSIDQKRKLNELYENLEKEKSEIEKRGSMNPVIAEYLKLEKEFFSKNDAIDNIGGFCDESAKIIAKLNEVDSSDHLINVLNEKVDKKLKKFFEDMIENVEISGNLSEDITQLNQIEKSLDIPKWKTKNNAIKEKLSSKQQTVIKNSIKTTRLEEGKEKYEESDFYKINEEDLQLVEAFGGELFKHELYILSCEKCDDPEYRSNDRNKFVKFVEDNIQMKNKRKEKKDFYAENEDQILKDIELDEKRNNEIAKKKKIFKEKFGDYYEKTVLSGKMDEFVKIFKGTEIPFSTEDFYFSEDEKGQVTIVDSFDNKKSKLEEKIIEQEVKLIKLEKLKKEIEGRTGVTFNTVKRNLFNRKEADLKINRENTQTANEFIKKYKESIKKIEPLRAILKEVSDAINECGITKENLKGISFYNPDYLLNYIASKIDNRVFEKNEKVETGDVFTEWKEFDLQISSIRNEIKNKEEKYGFVDAEGKIVELVEDINWKLHEGIKNKEKTFLLEGTPIENLNKIEKLRLNLESPKFGEMEDKQKGMEMITQKGVGFVKEYYDEQLENLKNIEIPVGEDVTLENLDDCLLELEKIKDEIENPGEIIKNNEKYKNMLDIKPFKDKLLLLVEQKNIIYDSFLSENLDKMKDDILRGNNYGSRIIEQYIGKIKDDMKYCNKLGFSDDNAVVKELKKTLKTYENSKKDIDDEVKLYNEKYKSEIDGVVNRYYEIGGKLLDSNAIKKVIEEYLKKEKVELDEKIILQIKENIVLNNIEDENIRNFYSFVLNNMDSENRNNYVGSKLNSVLHELDNIKNNIFGKNRNVCSERYEIDMYIFKKIASQFKDVSIKEKELYVEIKKFETNLLNKNLKEELDAIKLFEADNSTEDNLDDCNDELNKYKKEYEKLMKEKIDISVDEGVLLKLTNEIVNGRNSQDVIERIVRENEKEEKVFYDILSKFNKIKAYDLKIANLNGVVLFNSKNFDLFAKADMAKSLFQKHFIDEDIVMNEVVRPFFNDLDKELNNTMPKIIDDMLEKYENNEYDYDEFKSMYNKLFETQFDKLFSEIVKPGIEKLNKNNKKSAELRDNIFKFKGAIIYRNYLRMNEKMKNKFNNYLNSNKKEYENIDEVGRLFSQLKDELKQDFLKKFEGENFKGEKKDFMLEIEKWIRKEAKKTENEYRGLSNGIVELYKSILDRKEALTGKIPKLRDEINNLELEYNGVLVRSKINSLLS